MTARELHDQLCAVEYATCDAIAEGRISAPKAMWIGYEIGRGVGVYTSSGRNELLAYHVGRTAGKLFAALEGSDRC